MADTLNLSDGKVAKELINTQLHLDADSTSDYYSTNKYMNDYSLNFEPQ